MTDPDPSGLDMVMDYTEQRRRAYQAPSKTIPNPVAKVRDDAKDLVGLLLSAQSRLNPQNETPADQALSAAVYAALALAEQRLASAEAMFRFVA